MSVKRRNEAVGKEHKSRVGKVKCAVGFMFNLKIRLSSVMISGTGCGKHRQVSQVA